MCFAVSNTINGAIITFKPITNLVNSQYFLEIHQCFFLIIISLTLKLTLGFSPTLRGTL